jgi:MYXO-CTERM domain-containing protein
MSRNVLWTLLLLPLLGCYEGEEFDTNSDNAAIVGGVSVDINSAPYQVSLQINGSHLCGGTIVSDRWIISAAHCGQPQTIVAGVTKLSLAAQGQTINVKRTIINPGYTAPTNGGDLSLIELETPLALNGTTVTAIRPQVVANTTLEDAGVIAKVTGWGALATGGGTPDDLQAVDVPLVSLADASLDYAQTLSGDQLAAGLRGVGGKDACQGDSGGPLVVTDPKTGATKLVGVVSWGNGCAEADYPGMYARVSSFNGFIDANLGGPPTAVAGTNTSASPGGNVTLDASGSYDEGFGELVSFQWEQTLGEPIQIDGTQSTLSFTAPNKAGELVFQLTVTDDVGTSAVDTVTVDVRAGGGDDGGNGGGGGGGGGTGNGEAGTGTVTGGCSTSGSSSTGGAFAMLMGLALLWRRRRSN